MYQNIKAAVMGSINMDMILNMERVPETGENVLGTNYGYANGGKGGYILDAGNYYITAASNVHEAINAIIGENYDENNAPEMKDEAVLDVEGLSKATVSLGAKISFVFYPTEDAEKYTFTIGGAKLETEIAEGGYIIVTTYAYAIKETVEYTVEGTDITGSYNLKAYYDYMLGEGNGSAELLTLVERLFKYSESCEAYRNEVNS